MKDEPKATRNRKLLAIMTIGFLVGVLGVPTYAYFDEVTGRFAIFVGWGISTLAILVQIGLNIAARHD